MPKMTMIRNDGTMKAIDFEPWGGIDGFLEATSPGANTTGIDKLRAIVPWLQRAVNMTANAVSTLPFSVVDKAGSAVDTSADWQNMRGGIASPKRLLYLIAASLCSGAAYARITATNKVIADVRYQIPNTITPEFDQSGAVLRFRRQTTSGKIEMIPVEEMLYFWLPDDTVETGPAYIHPVRNAALSAELLGQMDTTLKTYGKNGFIPPMILSAKGIPSKPEAEKAEKWWNLFLRGKAGVAKIFNAESITPQAVGAGMAEMRGSYIQITRQQIENIGAAFGIPAGVFMSNAANYATALADRRNWYESGTFVLLYQTIQEVMTDQVYKRFGLRFQFNLEGLDAFQDDEVQKATSFGAYVSAGLPKSLAAELVGLDLPAGWEYEDLDEEPEAEPEPEPVDTTEDVPAEDAPEDDGADMADEIMTWQRYAAKNHTRPFEPHVLPLALAVQIQARLKGGYSDVIFTDALAEIPTIMLAKAINGR